MRGMTMKAVSMLEFRLHANEIIRKITRGQRMVLTYRGKSVARLEPFVEQAVSPDDPFYSLAELADSRKGSMTNREIDKALYEV
jgi:antitoxin (DNA-binding transcriptional repressor) of toxin-antitoxin stability system